MSRKHRRQLLNFKVRFSTANLPGTLFLLILMMCACMFVLTKGISSLRQAYAESLPLAVPTQGTMAPAADAPQHGSSVPPTAEPASPNRSLNAHGHDPARLHQRTSREANQSSSSYILIPSAAAP